jgi:L-ascorbate metabolism protein UlaG (beta-lactamase superfamily)
VLQAERVLTTTAGAERLGADVVGLDPWDAVTLDRPDDGSVTITAVPALHGPPGSAEITGPVIGFVLSGEDLQTVYVSGDNASLEVVREVAQRVGPVDVAILFAGAVQIASRFDGAYLTLSSDRAAEAALILQARVAIPVHFEGWTHFTQGADQLRAAFHGNGVADRLRLPGRGETVEA